MLTSLLRSLHLVRRPELCPFCFQEFDLRQAPFRCSNRPEHCAPEVDAVLAKRWGESLPVGHVIPAPSRVVRQQACERCGYPSDHRLCPHCHSALPHTVGYLDSLHFTVIGAKAAGKSHFTAVLVDRLRRQVGRDLGLILRELDDRTTTHYREDFHGPVYERHQIIPGTRSAMEDVTTQRPLLFGLTLTGRRRRAVTLAFFDTAGEDLDAEDTMLHVNRSIIRSDGIILLLDPLQLPRVRERLDGSVALPTRNTDSVDIVNRTLRLIQNGRGMRFTDRVSIPIAVAFSKLDAVTSLLGPHSELRHEPRHRGGYHAEDAVAVDQEMRALLVEWGADDLLRHVTDAFVHHRFFGLSALGCNPHDTQQIPTVRPQRVEDPFLWLLHHHGLLREVRS